MVKTAKLGIACGHAAADATTFSKYRDLVKHLPHQGTRASDPPQCLRR
jgi:hypothetical protein